MKRIALTSVFIALFSSADGQTPVDARHKHATPAMGKTINAASIKFADVAAAVSQAQNGDTVAVPAGTASWTSTLVINKGISLLGQTTTDPVAGTANDQTIITDNVARISGGAPIIKVTTVAGKSYRVSGLTFQEGSLTTKNNNGAITIGGVSQLVRLDHCHILPLKYQNTYIAVTGAIQGVVDHNVLEYKSGAVGNNTVHMANWGGQVNGDGSWAEAANYGSDKFFFFEDNYIINTTSNQFAGDFDDTYGARWVVRH